jgi:hypothetical protein
MDSRYQSRQGAELIGYVVLQAAAIADLHSNTDWSNTPSEDKESS